MFGSVTSRCVSRAALALAGSLALASCDMAPRYVRPAMPVPPELPQGPAYAPAEAGSTQTADIAWRDFFADDRLRKLIELSLANNRDLRIAVANVAQARAQYRVQRAGILPTIDVGGSASFDRTPNATGKGTPAARTDTYSVTAGVSAWEIDLFGRLRNLSKEALEQYFASAGNRDAAQVALIAEDANAWVTLAADQDRLTLARETAQAFGETLSITRGRALAGVASDLDVQQAQTSYDQARSDIAAETTAVAQDRNALDLLAGSTVPPDMLPAGLGTREATLSDLPAGLPSQVLLRRPDIQAAEHQLRAANASIGAARAAFFPNISLTAAAGTMSLGLSSLFGNGSGYWSVSPAATIPIFDFGRNKGNLRYAEATRDAMVATYEKSVQTGFREVADALARRGTIGAQLEAQTSQRNAAAAAYRLAQARYREGVDPFLNTLDTERVFYSAEQSLLATRLERQTNAIELYRALGGGLR
ncbi:efflux transporter outer membrane subunit [Sphingomonas oryzagri]